MRAVTAVAARRGAADGALCCRAKEAWQPLVREAAAQPLRLPYGVPQALAAAGSNIPAGFIRVPMLPEQLVALEDSGGRAAAGRCCLPLDWMVRAAEAAVTATALALAGSSAA